MNAPATKVDPIAAMRRAQQEQVASINAMWKRFNTAENRRAFRRAMRLAEKAGCKTHPFFSVYDGGNLYLYLEHLDSFTEPRVLRLMEKLDALFPFDRSSDTSEGREFNASRPGLHIKLQLQLKDPDNSEKCRRIVKSVKPGMPYIEYGYVCN